MRQNVSSLFSTSKMFLKRCFWNILFCHTNEKTQNVTGFMENFKEAFPISQSFQLPRTCELSLSHINDSRSSLTLTFIESQHEGQKTNKGEQTESLHGDKRFRMTRSEETAAEKLLEKNCSQVSIEPFLCGSAVELAIK